MPTEKQARAQDPQNLTSLALELNRCPPQEQQRILSAIFAFRSIGNTPARVLATIFNTASRWGMLNELAAWPCADDAVRKLAASARSMYRANVADATVRLLESSNGTHNHQGRRWMGMLFEGMQQPWVVNSFSAQELVTMACASSKLAPLEHQAWMHLLLPRLPKALYSLNARGFETLVCASSKLDPIEHQAWMQQLWPRLPNLVHALNAQGLANIAHASSKLAPSEHEAWTQQLLRRLPDVVHDLNAREIASIAYAIAPLPREKRAEWTRVFQDKACAAQATAQAADAQSLDTRMASAHTTRRLQTGNTSAPLPPPIPPFQLRAGTANMATSSSSLLPLPPPNTSTHNPYAPLWGNPDPTHAQEMFLHPVHALDSTHAMSDRRQESGMQNTETRAALARTRERLQISNANRAHTAVPRTAPQVHAQHPPPAHSTNSGLASSTTHRQPARTAPQHLGR